MGVMLAQSNERKGPAQYLQRWMAVCEERRETRDGSAGRDSRLLLPIVLLVPQARDPWTFLL